MPMLNTIQCCFDSAGGRLANKRWYFKMGNGSGSGFNRVVSFQLQDVSVPSSFLVIGDYITDTTLTIETGAGSYSTSAIPSGNYTAEQLATQIQTVLNENTLTLTFTVTYDTTLNLYTITGSGAYTLDPTLFSQWLGFGTTALTGVGITASCVCLVSGPPTLYLQSNMLASLQCGIVSSFSSSTAGLIAGVPLAATPGLGINIYQFMLLKHLKMTSPKQVLEIDFTWLYPDDPWGGGRQVDFRCVPWTINLVINTLDCY